MYVRMDENKLCILEWMRIKRIYFRMDENKHGMTPLLCAAERCQAMMVEYLIGTECYYFFLRPSNF